VYSHDETGSRSLDYELEGPRNPGVVGGGRGSTSEAGSGCPAPQNSQEGRSGVSGQWQFVEVCKVDREGFQRGSSGEFREGLTRRSSGGLKTEFSNGSNGGGKRWLSGRFVGDPPGTSD
jgi:hypothetical protein